jgi:uncharacterized protein DUF4129
MTSEPGTTGPGTASDTGTPEVAPRAGAGSSWPLVLPLALLIILGLAGLRGAVTAPRWNESLRHDGLAIGLALEVVLGVLLVVTARRRSRASRAAALGQVPLNEVAAKLREVLLVVLGTGMIAVAVAYVISLHLRFPPHHPRRNLPTLALPTVGFTATPRRSQVTDVHFPLAASLYGVLIAALVAGVLLSIWWARRFRPSLGAGRRDFVAQDPEDLLEAVESGRSALRTFDDARAAIVACYVAMENRLAQRGAARAAAETPDELLARASASGLVRGTAAERLTALFYEARFSSHPLGREQRDAAEQALDELAAALAEPTQAGAGA